MFTKTNSTDIWLPNSGHTLAPQLESADNIVRHDTASLVSPNGILCLPKYMMMKVPGAMAHVWLQADVVARLLRVDQVIQAQTNGRGRLCIWDGLRNMQAQEYLYERERARIDHQFSEKTKEAREAMLNNIVRPPSRELIPPHLTGGAVDCTIWFDDREDALGLFDDFSDRGRSDFFERFPARNEDDARMQTLRLIHREAMQEEDFVNIDSEFWHWEFGTRYWAMVKQCNPIYDTILEAPDSESPALRYGRTPARHVEVQHGIGQVFATPEDRGRSLRGEVPGRYYARTRHWNERQVAKKFSSMIGAQNGVLLPSGLNAAVLSVLAYAPKGARIVLDCYTYYETYSSLLGFAPQNDWELCRVDLSDPAEIAKQRDQRTSVFFVDHPRNWLLTCPQLDAVRQVSAQCGGRLIVDISVQPLQQLLTRGLADLVCVSFSKYPSAGQTAGGGVFGPNDLLKPVNDLRLRFGDLLAPEAAATILQYLPSLRDRLTAISLKARRVAAFLRDIPFVSDVRLPNLDHVDALPGGQLTFRLLPELATRVENIIAANTLDPDFPLAFACTFGAPFTAIENFDSRNTETTRPSVGSDYIEPGRIRLSIGHEDADLIIEKLRFVLFGAVAAI